MKEQDAQRQMASINERWRAEYCRRYEEKRLKMQEEHTKQCARLRQRLEVKYDEELAVIKDKLEDRINSKVRDYLAYYDTQIESTPHNLRAREELAISKEQFKYNLKIEKDLVRTEYKSIKERNIIKMEEEYTTKCQALWQGLEADLKLRDAELRSEIQISYYTECEEYLKKYNVSGKSAIFSDDFLQSSNEEWVARTKDLGYNFSRQELKERLKRPSPLPEKQWTTERTILRFMQEQSAKWPVAPISTYQQPVPATQFKTVIDIRNPPQLQEEQQWQEAHHARIKRTNQCTVL